jgi:hypothetical protein
MTRVLLILSIVFAAEFANASQEAPQYEGTFQAKGTSNSGVNYDRRFKLTVRFFPRTDLVAAAQVDEVLNAETSVPYCKTHVGFELGKVQIQARDNRTGETVTQILPWTSSVSDSVQKAEGQPCSVSNLEGKPVVGSVTHTFELKSAVHGKGTSLSIETEPVFEGILPGDWAMVSTLQKISGDTYAVLPFSPHANALVNWLYVHEETAGLTWGSSGGVTLKLKK